jgi:hypothetical protein
MSETADITFRTYKNGSVSVHRNGFVLGAKSYVWVRDADAEKIPCRFMDMERALVAMREIHVRETVVSEIVMTPEEILASKPNEQPNARSFSDWLVDKIENFFGIKDKD